MDNKDPISFDQPRNHLVFYVNGRKHDIKGVEPETTLLQYLRGSSVGLTGTKLGCGEGGCGACTVMVSSYDFRNKAIRHLAVNACLAPLCSVDWCHVTTVEGIGSMRRGLHPVQKRIAEMHGSQCGFCTPGIVMALYALLRSNPSASAEDIEVGLDGNLCRCTGYRPILDAAKSLGKNGGDRSGCCRGNSGACPCLDVEVTSERTSPTTSDGGSSSLSVDRALDAAAGAMVDTQEVTGHGASRPEDGLPARVGARRRECTVSRGRDPRYTERYSDKCEPIFPPSLALRAPGPVTITGRNVTWHYPTSLQELMRLKAAHPEARIVAGNTEVGIEVKFKNMRYPVLISPTRVPELGMISDTTAEGVPLEQNGVFIGGATPLSSVELYLDEVDKRLDGARGSGALGGAARACVDMLRWFASTQIRNVACLAGNLATASPISDMNPLLGACGAQVLLESIRAGRRRVNVRDFFVKYRTVAMEPDEVIVGVFLPHATRSAPFEFVRPFKQARRREDDISIVTAGIRVRLEPQDGRWIIADCGLCFGGMAPTTLSAKATEAYLVGKEWSSEVIAGASQTLADDLPLPHDVPGGQCEYRRALPPSFLFKFFVDVCLKLEALYADFDEQLPLPPPIGNSDRSAATNFVTEPKLQTRGQQEYTPREGGLHFARPEPHAPKLEQESAGASEANENGSGSGGPGQPVPHKSAGLQVSGEAMYTDDMSSPNGTLYAGLVLSSKAHAKLLSVDPAEALEVEGVVRFLGAQDIPPDRNAIGAILQDEQVFAHEKVVCYGQVIGAVLADTATVAEEAAKLVKVEYEDLPALMTIEDAIAAQSFFADRHTIVDGNIEETLADAEVVVEGELKIGAQDHFYLETNATLAVPGEDGSMEIFASTQNPMKTQNLCAHVCGVPSNRVVCRTKRMGGGFGGKETRSVFLSCVAAVGAHLSGRPVRLSLDREVDMQITGHRHSFFAKYKAGASKSGKLQGLDVTLYSNAGCSLDLSASVMDRALFHIDNCYSWPALRVRGLVCKTNQASHTAFRGFGGPQGMMVTETVLDHLASALDCTSSELRTLNMYQPGERTHFGQELEAWNVPDAWSDLHEIADITRRRKEVDDFNAANRWRKRGLAVVPTKFGICFTAGFMNQGGALVHVYLDGTVLVSHGGTEMGQGLHTKVCQVVAKEFDIQVEKVHIAETATDRVANSSPTAASMSTDLYGMAALDACEQITERLRPVAESMPPGSSFVDVVKAAYFKRINLSAQGFYKLKPSRCGYDFNMQTDDNQKRGLPFNYFTQGVAASEVEVDCLTGDARVLRVDIVMDIGTSINPAIDIGQIEGAFIQGFGWCTMEETAWGDSEHRWVRPGQLFTRGPGTYKIPSFNDVPLDMRVKLMNRKNAFAVHSSKAVGEPPFFLSASAFFAIKHAVAAARKDHGEEGYFPLMSPATSERIRTACLDRFMEASVGDGLKGLQPKGSW